MIYNDTQCDLCREQPKHPSAFVRLADDWIAHTCLDCRRVEIQTDGVLVPTSFSDELQDAFEVNMKPLGYKANRVKVRFA
jgi:hypothetical protein